MTNSTAPATLEEALARRPLNWADMGSSQRDLWEERIERDFLKRQARITVQNA